MLTSDAAAGCMINGGPGGSRAGFRWVLLRRSGPGRGVVASVSSVAVATAAAGSSRAADAVEGTGQPAGGDDS